MLLLSDARQVFSFWLDNSCSGVVSATATRFRFLLLLMLFFKCKQGVLLALNLRLKLALKNRDSLRVNRCIHLTKRVEAKSLQEGIGLYRVECLFG